MKKKFLLCLICILICSLAFISCNKKNKHNTDTDDVAYAYCSTYYGADFGNGGSFSVSPMENAELETSFSDLSKFTLGGAFSGMSIETVKLSDDGLKAEFYIIGELSSGETGSVEGKGIIKGKNVKVDVPVTQAFADTSSVVYGNIAEQKITLNLTSACFNKNLTASDFVLSGAVKDMTVKSVETQTFTDTDGEEFLSQTAELTLTGNPDGTDYAYIKILSSATTFNKDLNVTLKTDFYGGVITNNVVDTYKLSDTVYVQARNITFKSDIKNTDVTLSGAFKNYAEIVEVDYVNEQIIAIKMKFPYTYFNVSGNVGSLEFSANSNAENVSFTCSTLLNAPEISYDLKINENNVVMELTLEHEEFNLLDMYPFTIYKADGDELYVSNLETVNLGDYLSISFSVTEGFSGLLYFELENAYDIVNENGTTENVTIKTAFYV